MKINGIPYRSIWVSPEDRHAICIFDQTKFPFAVDILTLRDKHAVADAILTMKTRGAPLIGAAGAWGLALSLRTDPGNEAMEESASMLAETRPTAVNLRWAIDRMLEKLRPVKPEDRYEAARAEAALICDEDVLQNEAIGRNGFDLIKDILKNRPSGKQINILTHCNAGWIATVDWGTALAPIYMAADSGVNVHVWVDETRPRNQGASLTAWELGKHGVPHTVIADNAGGHLMQHGLVDLVIVGTDRVTRTGDVANKIGTYLKALAAKDNNVPFWVALPSTTIDWNIRDGIKEIPIEERSASEVSHIAGMDADGIFRTVRLMPEGSKAANPAFDVTPAHLVTGLITERGCCAASEEGLLSLFPERS